MKPTHALYHLHLLGRYLRPQWPKALLMATLLLTSIGLQLFTPQLLRRFIDLSADGAEPGVLLRTAGLFLALALCNQLLSAWATYSSADVAWTATNALRLELSQHCLRLDMGFHNARTPGEFIERIDGDVSALANFFSQFSVRIVGSMLLLMGIVVLLWRESPMVGALLGLFIVLVLLLLNRGRAMAVPASHDEREVSAKLLGFIEERLAGIEDIRANGGGAYTMQRFHGVMRQFFVKGSRAWLMRLRIWLLSFSFFSLGTVLTLAAAVYLFQQGRVTLGTAYLFFQYMLMLEAPIEHLTQQLSDLQKATAAIGRVTELLQTESRLPLAGDKQLPAGALPLSLNKVSFAYDDKAVLEDISLQLAPGEVLGVMGRTGSGKSTLSRLLLRFYEPSSGSVRMAGLSVAEIAPASLYARVALVSQEVQLFHASVRDNLSFFNPDMPDARMVAVLEQLGLGDWLHNLPQGLDSLLRTGGSGLSAGEAQLLAFARVFLKDPGLVILDEPSSRLDPASEMRLERALDSLLQGRSAVIIAHRLATLQRADKILLLQDGCVLEYGSRSSLAANPHSHYHRMLTLSRHPEPLAQVPALLH